MTIFADSDVWDFRRDDRGEWAWQRQSVLGEVISESRRRFGDFDECVSDAKRCGYATQTPLALPPEAPAEAPSDQIIAR